MNTVKFMSDEAGDVKRNLLFATFLIVLLYIVGIFFYHVVEGWDYLDAAFFLTVTFTTIGYGEHVPLTQTGKIFTMIIAWVGISTGFFLLYSIAAYREKVLDRKIIDKLHVLRTLLIREEKEHHHGKFRFKQKLKEHLYEKGEYGGA